MRSGLLNLLKPPGITSHDVVRFVRSLLPRGTKVGHAGTLDPGAAGVLVVCVGVATRLTEYVMEGEKCYRAEACLGVETDTLDAEGRVVAVRDASGVSESDVRRELESLVGPQMMAPPMFSAARVGGKRLYELAREGREVERVSKPIVVHSAELVRFRPGPRAEVLVDIRCTKGTYIRVLCAQLGERLGIGAHMSFLVRTELGQHRLADAITLEEFRAAVSKGEGERLCIPAEVAVAHLTPVRLGLSEATAFVRGTAIACRASAPGVVRVHGPDGGLLGVGEVYARKGREILQPRKVLLGR